jgi:hypothetical protein
MLNFIRSLKSHHTQNNSNYSLKFTPKIFLNNPNKIKISLNKKLNIFLYISSLNLENENLKKKN